MTANKNNGFYFLSASIGYVVGKTIADKIRKKRQKPVESSIERARRMMNNK